MRILLNTVHKSDVILSQNVSLSHSTRVQGLTTKDYE